MSSSNNSGSSKSSSNNSNNYPTIVEWFTKNDPVFVSIDGFIINIEDKPRASKDENSISTLENDDDDDDGESLLSLKRSQDSLNSLSEASTWRRCRTCHCTFETKEEHRGHFSTPWHLYNVKAVSKGESPLTQEEYDAKMLSEMGNGSVSTKPCTDEFSDNNSSSSGDDDDPAYKDASSDGDGESEDDEDVEDIEEEIPGRTPMVIFADKKGEQIVVWRCVLEAIAGVKKLVTLGNEAGVRSACQAFVRNIRGSGGAPAARCAVFLCRSGYFAGAVFDGRTLVAHKTFRRYTCRRKQGKSQSNYDAKGKQPHSAGAAKRRYHERRYVEEVNEVVTSWAKELAAAACPLVLVSAPKVQRAGKLLLFDGSPLTEASDVRVRKVPFPTRHPSLAVAESIHRMTFAAVPPSALETQQHQEQQQEEGEGESESGSVTCEDGGMSKSDVVKEVTVSLLVNVSRLPEIATFKTLLEQLSKSGKPKKEQRAILSAVLAPVCAAGNLACAEALIGGGATHSHVAEDTGMTPLHYAARSGNYELVQLLLKSGASKGVKDGAGKVPAEYAVNDKVKELLSVAKPKKAGKKNKNKKKKKQQQRCVSVYDIEDSSDEEDEDEEQDGKGKGKKKVVQKKQEKKKEKEKEEKKKEELPPPPPRVFVDPVTCVICGKQEERKKSFMNSGKRFCSMDCVRKFLNN